ncbi:MAG: hypothetical protein WCT03_18605 [Candidatus Obscuribacterales bacterium]|jgi:hypothetical protein
MKNHDNLGYGLELTNNSKVGWAFSLPRVETCINATDICRAVCYGNGIRYQSKGQKEKRARNLRTVQFLLAEGGPELLAENLSMLVERARPRDWLTARITGVKTAVPWSVRIHDVGDYFSIEYVLAWLLVVQKYVDCSFWFYTRSFVELDMLMALTELAALPNCQGWLSVDSENFSKAMLAKCNTPVGVWKLALMQDKDLVPEVIVSLKQSASLGEIVHFPVHRGGRHVEPIRDKVLTTCPAVTGAYKLQNNSALARPCQICSFCLP